ncbi:MAG TPA: CPBP family glutamic-type intramembrane protease [Rhodanobacteraceae bacterium]|nr:CPBP family glutamic-type intramembrane protease [Rhodanobacteraceae bacterium]
MRTWGLAAVAALLAAACLLALAAGLTRHAIDRHAGQQAWLYAHDQTPWQWAPRTADDLIAGHAFGAAVVLAGEDSLRLRSRNGTSYAIGLPLARPLDLRRFPQLQLRLESPVPFTLKPVVREQLDGPLLLGQAIEMPASSSSTPRRLDLRSLSWRDNRGAPIAAPDRAALLRLRLEHAGGTTLTLRKVAARPRAGARMRVAEPPDPIVVAGADVAARARAHDAALPRRTVPVFLLPPWRSAETLLALRDRLHDAVPAAIVAADPGWRAATARPAHLPPPVIAVGVAIYAALLLRLWLRPPTSRRWRAALEVAACLVPPLAWTIGLRGTLPAHNAWWAAVGLALAFACLLELRWRPSHWRWFGSDWRDWLWPLLAVVAALLMLLACRALPVLPAPRQWLVYLLWALLQQLVVLAVVARRLEWLAGHRAWAVLGAALAFALLHTPNGWLMQLTFVAELWWAWCFLRRPALLPIAVAHAIAALLLQASLRALPLRSLEVGARFLGP